jgi:NTP pyrophosphatase (non-canonical NTP hydrolase)
MPKERDFKGASRHTCLTWVAEEALEVAQEPNGSKAARIEALDLFGAVVVLLHNLGVSESEVKDWAIKQAARDRDAVYDPAALVSLLNSTDESYLPGTVRP